MSSFNGILAFTDGDQWRAGIGDPTVMGWMTVAAYFVTSLACLKVALARAKAVGGWKGREAIFWLLLCGGMLVLGVNKQLDLQTWLTLTVRKLFVAQGWYEYRRGVQALFVVILGMAALLGCGMVFVLTKGRLRENGVALAGIIFVAGFVMIRAASFHHVDLFLKSDVGGVRMNWVFELFGIGLIFWNAVRVLSRHSAGKAGSQKGRAGGTDKSCLAAGEQIFLK